MINHCDDGRAKGRALLLAPALLALAVTAFGQQPELLPTVKLRPASTTPAQTTDCATGLAAAAPRLAIEPARPPEMPRAVERATAASRDTSTLLRRVQDAAEANDRTAFKATLESARAGVRDLDTGAQRTRADQILKVYDDIQRVWDYSFATPTGSFFSAESQGGTLLAAMSRYPGYSDFIRKQSLVDQEHERFYPTRETRAFLTTQAEHMLLGARLGTVAGTKTPVAGSEPSRSPSASRKSLQAGRSSSSDRKAHHPSSGTKSSTARPHAPKSLTTASEPSGSSATPTPKRASGRGSHRKYAETPHPTKAASSGMPRSAARRPQSEPTSGSSPTTRNPVRGSTSIPAAAPRNEPQKPPAAPSGVAVTSSSPVTGSTPSSSSNASASGQSSAPTTAPSGTSTMSASGTSSTTSSTSSSTIGGETTGAAETTTGPGTPTPRTSEPPVPSGGRTYLSILMVVIGLIVLIVLIRASK
jgi:hypothetical protein